MNGIQAEAAEQFLGVMRHYVESLCSEMRSHTITNVQSTNDRVSYLIRIILVIIYFPRLECLISFHYF